MGLRAIFKRLDVVAILVGLMWVMCWHTTSVMLAADARAKLTEAAACNTPFRWSFESKDDIIPGGTGGMTPQFGSSGLSGSLQENQGRVFLRMPRGLQVDTFHQVSASVCGPAGAKVALGFAAELVEPQSLSTNCETLRWDLRSIQPAALTELRVHLFGQPGDAFQIESISVERSCPLSEAARQQLSLSDPTHMAQALDMPLAIIERPALRLAPTLALRDEAIAANPNQLFIGPWYTDYLELFAPTFSYLVIAIPWFLTVLTLVFLCCGHRAFKRKHRVRALELIGLTTLISWALIASHIVVIVAVGLILSAFVFADWAKHKKSLLNLGNRRQWITTAAVVALLVIGFAVISDRPIPQWQNVAQSIWMYALWAFVQQSVLCLVFTARLQKFRPKKPAYTSLCAAFLFGFLHLPNWELALGTMLLGFFWSWTYLQERTIWPQVVSHALLGSLALEWLETDQLYALQVGVFLLN